MICIILIIRPRTYSYRVGVEERVVVDHGGTFNQPSISPLTHVHPAHGRDKRTTTRQNAFISPHFKSHLVVCILQLFTLTRPFSLPGMSRFEGDRPMPLEETSSSRWTRLSDRLKGSFSGADPRVCVAFWLFGAPDILSSKS